VREQLLLLQAYLFLLAELSSAQDNTPYHQVYTVHRLYTRVYEQLYLTANPSTCQPDSPKLTLSDPMLDLVRHYDFLVPDAFLDL
jgi:hypothetical protein